MNSPQNISCYALHPTDQTLVQKEFHTLTKGIFAPKGVFDLEDSAHVDLIPFGSAVYLSVVRALWSQTSSLLPTDVDIFVHCVLLDDYLKQIAHLFALFCTTYPDAQKLSFSNLTFQFRTSQLPFPIQFVWPRSLIRAIDPTHTAHLIEELVANFDVSFAQWFVRQGAVYGSQSAWKTLCTRILNVHRPVLRPSRIRKLHTFQRTFGCVLNPKASFLEGLEDDDVSAVVFRTRKRKASHPLTKEGDDKREPEHATQEPVDEQKHATQELDEQKHATQELDEQKHATQELDEQKQFLYGMYTQLPAITVAQLHQMSIDELFLFFCPQPLWTCQKGVFPKFAFQEEEEQKEKETFHLHCKPKHSYLFLHPLRIRVSVSVSMLDSSRVLPLSLFEEWFAPLLCMGWKLDRNDFHFPTSVPVFSSSQDAFFVRDFVCSSVLDTDGKIGVQQVYTDWLGRCKPQPVLRGTPDSYPILSESLQDADIQTRGRTMQEVWRFVPLVWRLFQIPIRVKCPNPFVFSCAPFSNCLYQHVRADQRRFIFETNDGRIFDVEQDAQHWWINACYQSSSPFDSSTILHLSSSSYVRSDFCIVKHELQVLS